MHYKLNSTNNKMTAVEKRMDINDSLVGAPSGKCMIPDSFSKWQRVEYTPEEHQTAQIQFLYMFTFLGHIYVYLIPPQVSLKV